MIRPIAVSVALVGAFIVVTVLLGRLTTTEEQQQRREFVESREPFAPDTFRLMGRLSRTLRETSGLAVSVQHDGVLWTHNDSGDEPVLYALGLDGSIISRFRLNAFANDWEAMAAGPCPHLDEVEHCLYAGDVGDNGRERETLQIYVLPEPDPFSQDEASRDVATLHFRYAEGPEDTEAIAVSPDGRITLATKSRTDPPRIYHIDAEVWIERLDAEIMVLEAADTLPITPAPGLGRLITGGSYSPSGDRLVLRSYSEIFFFTVAEDGRAEMAGEACFLGAAEVQGEAVDFLDERVLVTSSEADDDRAATLHRVVCR